MLLIIIFPFVENVKYDLKRLTMCQNFTLHQWMVLCYVLIKLAYMIA